MLIDWFTVFAQVVNFIILVFLLKRFLYQPVLNAIDEREKLVAARLSDAAKKEDDAKKISDELKIKIKAFDDQSLAQRKEVTKKIDIEGERLLEVAKKVADESSAKWHKSLKNEASQLQQAIIQQTQEEVLMMTRKTLTDLADIKLESQMIDVFTKKIKEISGEKKERLRTMVKGNNLNVILRTAFELSASQLETIKNTVNESLEAKVQIQQEIKTDLTCGIELMMNGQMIAWSIDNYLVSIEESVNKMLKSTS